MIPKKFSFSSLSAGIYKKGRKDIGLIVSEIPAVSAATFTSNLVCAAPVTLSKEHLSNAKQRAIICNSGCANASTGRQGERDAKKTVALIAKATGFKQKEIFVASTGGIADMLPMKKIERAIPKLASTLGRDANGFCRAIMTTDAFPKTTSRRITVVGKKITIWAGAKGAGMIHPDMATMLCFILTDAALPKKLLQSTLKSAVDKSFNRITVDGDTSTNDSVFLLANGAAGNLSLKKGTAGYKKFAVALDDICLELAKKIVIDGEGAKRIAKVTVTKAATKSDALKVARAVSGSLLVKTALHGADPNWGRIIAAVGYSGVRIDPEIMELRIGPHCAYRNGLPVKNMETKLAAQMRKKEVAITVTLNRGKAEDYYWFCDIGRSYIKINADYRT